MTIFHENAKSMSGILNISQLSQLERDRPMPTRLVIIGGVAGGATAAARARRLDENAEIVLFERGEFVSFANCGLPYFIGGVIKKRDDLLVATPEMFRVRYNVDVRIRSEVTAIDRENRQVVARNLDTGETYSERYDKIILSPGAAPFELPIRDAAPDRVFSLRNIPDSDRIKAFVDEKQPEMAVIAGGGFIGLEMAENLVHRGVKTTIVEMLDQILPQLDREMASAVRVHLEKKGVACELGSAVASLSQKGDRLVVTTKNEREIECDMVIMSVGVRPENRLAVDAGLDIGAFGGIRVDAGMRTSDPDIFAVGDAVEVRDFVTGLPTMTPLAGPANKQGRIAADNAMGRKSLFKGTTGASVVKLFDMTVASVGPNEKTLEKHGIPYLAGYTSAESHAGYYPGAGFLTIKLLFSPDGKVLGAQIAGTRGVDKRIDVIATAIRGRMTVFDLEELELAYAPPYSSAKDPVNIAGFVAGNIVRGDLDAVTFKELDGLDRDACVFLDVRTAMERKVVGTIEGSLHIPIDELRGRLNELDREKTHIVYCAVGMRGYLAHRILAQNGIQSKNMSGGFKTYMDSMA